jgi:hypothetical protein
MVSLPEQSRLIRFRFEPGEGILRRAIQFTQKQGAHVLRTAWFGCIVYSGEFLSKPLREHVRAGREVAAKRCKNRPHSFEAAAEVRVPLIRIRSGPESAQMAL